MGASGWTTFTTFVAEPNDALRNAKAEVFESQAFYNPSGQKPDSIQALFELCAEDGTHSILDMSRCIGPADSPTFGTIRPLTEDELVRNFGSATPQRSQVDEASLQISLDRWTGAFFVVFEDGEPSEYCFFGVSGD